MYMEQPLLSTRDLIQSDWVYGLVREKYTQTNPERSAKWQTETRMDNSDFQTFLHIGLTW